MPGRGTHPFCAHSTDWNSIISNCKVWVMAQEREEWTWFLIHQDEPCLCWAGGGSRWLLGASPVPSICFWRFVFPFCNNLAKEKSGTCQLSFFSSFLIHFSFLKNFLQHFWCVIMDSENICLGNHKNAQVGQVCPGILALLLPRCLALGKWSNLSVPVLSALENKNNNNNNTYSVTLGGLTELRFMPFMVHLL